MKGLMKLLLGLVAVLLGLVVAGGAILGAFFDPNDYKTEIAQLAEEKAGISLQINGDINWSVFPWLGLELNQINARFQGQAELATLNRAQLAVRLPALLDGKVEMQSIVVDGLQLSLVQQSASKNNWTPPTVSAARPSAPTTSAAASVDSNPPASSTPPLALAIESVQITNAQLNWEDQVSGQRIRLTDLQVTTGEIATDTLIPLKTSFTAFQLQNDKPAAQLNAQLSTQLLLDLANQRYQLKGLDSLLTITAAALDNNELTLKLAADISADVDKQIALLDNLRLKLANLTLDGNLAVENFSSPAISGELAVAPFNLHTLLSELGQPAIKTADPDVLKAISLNAVLGGKANTVNAKQLTLKLDDTTFKGNAGFALKTGNISLNLAGDNLDADRYLPPKAETTESTTRSETAATPAGKKQWSKAPLIPVDTLKALEVDSTFKLAALKVSGLDLQNVDLAINAHGGLVQATKINLDMYGGTVRNSSTIDVRKTPVTTHTRKNINNIQIGDLLQALAQVDTLSGTFSSQSDIRTRGVSEHDIVNSLTGTAAVQMKDGEIKGIDMAQTLCQGMNTVGSLGINTQQVDRSTPFANLSASTTMKNGVVQNPDLKAALDSLSLSGKGNVDLPQQALNYRVGLTIEDNLFKKTCSIPDKLEGIEFPVDCKGGFDTEPAELCKPDLGFIEDILKAKAKAKVQEKVDEKKDELKKKLTEKLGEKLGGEEGAKQLLRGLFGQ